MAEPMPRHKPDCREHNEINQEASVALNGIVGVIDYGQEVEDQAGGNEQPHVHHIIESDPNSPVHCQPLLEALERLRLLEPEECAPA